MRTLILAFVAPLLLGAAVHAQDNNGSAPIAVAPAWDMNFSLGVIQDELQVPSFEFDHPEARFDIGRYWTTHFKTELGVTMPISSESSVFDDFAVPGLASRGYSITQQARQMTILTPAFTYQFLENAFAHPYVSTGMRVMLLQTHSTRDGRTYTENRISYAVPAVDRRDVTTMIRPFVAAGFKSYFNERTFIRSEALATFGGERRTHVALRMGFGFDF